MYMDEFYVNFDNNKKIYFTYWTKTCLTFNTKIIKMGKKVA